MFGINLKVIVAMLTKLCTHSISAHSMLLRFACCIPVLILKRQSTIFLKRIIFLKSLNLVFEIYAENNL